jgi:hypothetical protein
MKGTKFDGDEVAMGDWEGDKREQSGEAPPVGVYIWPVKVMSADYYDVRTDKPFILLRVTIEDTETRQSEFAGFSFDFRLYVNKNSEGWARWMLKKFGYPDEAGLSAKKPSIRRSLIVGLLGEVIVWVRVKGNYLNFDVKGFQRPGEDELEKNILPKLQEECDAENGGEAREPGADEAEGPAVDINAEDAGTTDDVNAQLSDLD